MDRPRLVKVSDGRRGRPEPIQQGKGSAMRSHLRGMEAVKAGAVERVIKGQFTDAPIGCKAEPSGSKWVDGSVMPSDYYGRTVHVQTALTVFEPAKRNPRARRAMAGTAADGSWWLENVEVVGGKARVKQDELTAVAPSDTVRKSENGRRAIMLRRHTVDSGQNGQKDG